MKLPDIKSYFAFSPFAGWRIRIYVGVALSLVVLVLICLPVSFTPATKQNIWDVVRAEAEPLGLDPEFVYDIIYAESTFRPLASSGKARGIMQLTPAAWEMVTEEPFAQAWNWKTNIHVGVLYLDHCGQFLAKHDQFSYPLLAASYRFGIHYVKRKKFDLKRIRKPKNIAYQKIFKNERPLTEIE